MMKEPIVYRKQDNGAGSSGANYLPFPEVDSSGNMKPLAPEIIEEFKARKAKPTSA